MFLFCVFFLNYLIAIVSDSYANIIESEAMTITLGRDDLNGEHLRRLTDEVTEDVDLIVMSTVIGES